MEEGLLDNFDTVIGFTEKYYGEGDYDKLDHEVSKLEGGRENALNVSKAEFVRAVLKREELKVRQAVLVEDDPAEIGSVRQICRAVFVRKRLGMMSTEMDRLRHLTSTPGLSRPRAPSGVKPPPAHPGAPAPPPGTASRALREFHAWLKART